MRGCMAVLVIAAVVIFGIIKVTSGGRLIFVAPTDSPLTITVDSRTPITLQPRGFTDANVGFGSHTITTVTSAGSRTVTVKADLSDATLVPASDRQCFVVLNVSDLYSQAGGAKMPEGWRPRIDERYGSAVTMAPKHIWVTDAPKVIKRDPNEPARILYPYDCETSEDDAVTAWLFFTFAPPRR